MVVLDSIARRQFTHTVTKAGYYLQGERVKK
jgi:hypothetical protein